MSKKKSKAELRKLAIVRKNNKLKQRLLTEIIIPKGRKIFKNDTEKT